MIHNNLIERYCRQFDENYVQQRRSNELTEVRVKPLDEYRALYEQDGRFLLITGEEITTTWNGQEADRTHWINAFNLPEAIAAQTNDGSSSAAIRQTCNAVQAMGQATRGRDRTA